MRQVVISVVTGEEPIGKYHKRDIIDFSAQDIDDLERIVGKKAVGSESYVEVGFAESRTITAINPPDMDALRAFVAARGWRIVDERTRYEQILRKAHADHLASVARWRAEGNPFDPFQPLDAPLLPQPSAQAEAGELIAERGLLLAVATHLQTILDRGVTDFNRAVGEHLIIAASEPAL